MSFGGFAFGPGGRGGPSGGSLGAVGRYGDPPARLCLGGGERPLHLTDHAVRQMALFRGPCQPSTYQPQAAPPGLSYVRVLSSLEVMAKLKNILLDYPT